MTEEVGISGFAVYVPPYRVNLESWCRWTDNVWDKTRAVVGHSFRMRGPAQSVYTMAATAVMRLIDRYEINPARVGFLAEMRFPARINEWYSDALILLCRS